MFAIGEYIIFRKDVCKILDIKKKMFQDKDYYVLAPITDASLTLEIPVDNLFIRKLMSKEEVEHIIRDIPHIPLIECHDKLIENEYKQLISTGKHEDLVRIIKTTYLRNKKRLDNKKRMSEKDDNFFNRAEQYLYNEFSVVLDMSFEETKKYVINQVRLLEEKEQH